MKDSREVQKQFSCDRCCYRGKTEAHLRNHKRVHTEKTFPCFQCGFKAQYKYLVARHNLVHSGERPFVCTHEGCTYSSSRAWNLAAHQLVHLKQKAFRCNLCGKCFRTSSNRGNHIRFHTGEKPYKCSFKECEYSSTTAGSLQRHFRRHTGEKPYRCSYGACEYSCIVGSNLKRHMKSHKAKTVSNFKPIKSLEVDEEDPKLINRTFVQFNRLKSDNCSYNQSEPLISATNIESFTDPVEKTKSRPDSCSSAMDDSKLRIPSVVVLKRLQVNYDSDDEYISDSPRPQADLASKRTEMNPDPHTGPTPMLEKAYLHTCKICNYETKNFKEYKLHLQSHREKSEFFCPLCDFVGFKKKFLKSHLRSHGIMTHDSPNS